MKKNLYRVACHESEYYHVVARDMDEAVDAWNKFLERLQEVSGDPMDKIKMRWGPHAITGIRCTEVIIAD